MDQVRAVVKVLWTQRFWVLSSICAIVGTLCWNMAASDLDKEFKARKSKIDSAFSSVTSIRNEQNHPNDNINTGDVTQTKKQRDFVLAVWRELYDRQRKEVLYWPESLGTRFINSMEGKKFGDSISTNMRDRYMNYIKTRFDGLLEIVDALKNEDGRSRGGGGEYGGGGFGAPAEGFDGDPEGEQDYLVQWLDQDKVRQKLAFKTAPDDMQVWITQEDLWVIETLLDVIAKTNKSHNATRPDNAPIRTIVSLQVGSEASTQDSGQVFIPEAPSGAEGGMGGEYGGYGGGEYGGGEFGGGGFGGGEYGGGGFGGGEYGGGGFGGGEYGGFGGEGFGGGGGTAGSASIANRYLDAEGNPDPGTSGSYGTTEFRQLPVRLTLYMDHTVIPSLLIKCANAALPIEVKQLRINHEKSGTGFGARSNSRRSKDMPEGANISSVVISGVVYIYNEPNTEELTIPGDDESSLPDDSV